MLYVVSPGPPAKKARTHYQRPTRLAPQRQLATLTIVSLSGYCRLTYHAYVLSGESGNSRPAGEAAPTPTSPDSTDDKLISELAPPIL